MKKGLRLLLTILCVAVLSVCFVACDNSGGDPKDPVKYEIAFSLSSVTLAEGEEKTVELTFSPSTETPEINVGDDTVATYSAGKVTGLKAGSTTVTASIGDKTATLSVTVTAAAAQTATVTIDGESKQYALGALVEKPSDPEKEATAENEYTFDGWYFGDKKWDFDTDTVACDMILEAKFTENARQYTVTVGESSYKAAYGAKLTAPRTPTKPSTAENEYTFDGWYFGDKKWDFDNDTVAGDMTLEAKYNESTRKYSVAFDMEFVTAEYGSKLIRPQDPTKESTSSVYYVFAGWFIYGTDTAWDFDNDVVTGDVALEAKFTEQERMFTYVYTFETETVKAGKNTYNMFTLTDKDYAAMNVELKTGNTTENLTVKDGKIIIEKPKGAYNLKITYGTQVIERICRITTDAEAVITIDQEVNLGGKAGETASSGSGYTVSGNNLVMTGTGYAMIGGEEPVDTVYMQAQVAFTSGIGQMAGFMPVAENKNLSGSADKLLFSFSANNRIYFQNTKSINTNEGIVPLTTLDSTLFSTNNFKFGVARIEKDYYVFIDDVLMAHYENDAYGKANFGIANTGGNVNITFDNVKYSVDSAVVKAIVADSETGDVYLGGPFTYPNGKQYQSFGSGWAITSPNSGWINATSYLFTTQVTGNVYYQEATFTRENAWVGLLVNTLDGQPQDNKGWYGYGVYAGGTQLYLHEFKASWHEGTYKMGLNGASGDTFKLGVARVNDYYYVFFNDKLVLQETVVAKSTANNSVSLAADNVSGMGIFRGGNFSEENKRVTFTDYKVTTDLEEIKKMLGSSEVVYGDNVTVEQNGEKIASGNGLMPNVNAVVKFDIPQGKVIKSYSLTKDGKSIGVELVNNALVFNPDAKCKYEISVEFMDAGVADLIIQVKNTERIVDGKAYGLYNDNIDFSKVTVKLANITTAIETVVGMENGTKSFAGFAAGYYKLSVEYKSNVYTTYFTLKPGEDAEVVGYVSKTYLGGQITIPNANGVMTTYNSFDNASPTATKGSNWELVDGKRDTVKVSSYTYAFQNDFSGTKYYVEGTFNSTQKITLGTNFGGLLLAHGPQPLTGSSDKKFEAAINGKSVIVTYIPDNWSPKFTSIIANYDEIVGSYDITAVRLGVVRDVTKYWFFVNDVYVGYYVLPEITNECGIGVVASASIDLTVSGFNYSDNNQLIEAYKSKAPAQENKKIDVYLVAGQSNASGCTNVSHDVVAALNDKYLYGFNNVYYAGNAGANWGHEIPFGLARVGLGESSTRMGPELGMAETLSKYYNRETGNQAVIIKYAVGGTNLLDYVGGLNASDGNWVSPSYEKTIAPVSKGNLTGGLYRKFFEEFDKQWQVLLGMGYQPQIKGLYWMQGEADKGSPAQYLTAFKLFVQDMRSDLTSKSGQDCSAMPVFVGEISRTSGSADPSTVATNEKFIAMQQTIPQHIANTYVIANGNLDINEWRNGQNVVVGSDTWHWLYTDAIKIGNMVGDSILKNALGQK